MKNLHHFFPITLFALLLIAFKADGKNKTLIPYHAEEKWGYANEKGKVVIPAQWNRADLFVNGKAVVTFREPWGGEQFSCLIDSKGNYIIPPSVHWTGSFNEIFNISDTSGNNGRIDSNGRIVIPIVYRSGGAHGYFNEQAKYYKFEKKQGGAFFECVVNSEAKVIIPAEYDRIDFISREPLYFFVYYPNHSGAAVLDSTAKTLLKFGPEGITCVPFFLDSTHTLVFRIEDYFLLWKDFPKGKIDTLRYLDISTASAHNIYRVQNWRGKYGAIDSVGKIVIDTIYDDMYFGKRKIITEQHTVDTVSRDEKFEYTFLDVHTLLPIDSPKTATVSEGENYVLAEESEDKENDKPDVNPYIKCDEVGLQGELVAYKKADYSFVLSPIIRSDLDVASLVFTYKMPVPVKVYRRNDNTFLGYSVADADLNLKAAPQPYDIVEASTVNKSYLLRSKERFAIADSSLRIVFPFQNGGLKSDNYFRKNGKMHAVCSRWDSRLNDAYSGYQIRNSDGTHDLNIRQPIIDENGDTLTQFSKYRRIQFLHSNWSIIDKGAENLLATDSAGKMGIINFKGNVLYGEVSFKYSHFKQLGSNLFGVSNDDKVYTLVNKHNSPIHPSLSLTSVSRPFRRYLDPKREDEQVAGLYLIAVFDKSIRGNYYFYINSKGTLFTDRPAN